MTQTIQLCEKTKRIRNIETGEYTDFLTPIQYRLYVVLREADGAIVSQLNIIDNVYAEDVQAQGVTPGAITALIIRLKRKISTISKADHVKTIRNWGFILEE